MAVGVEVLQGWKLSHSRPEDLDMSHATFNAPDLTTFCRLDDLGLVATGQRIEPARAVIECRVVDSDDDRWCRRCGGEGKVRDTIVRRLAHIPLGWRPTVLWVRARRYREIGRASCRERV